MDATTTELYISLLEKTNQQLSLYSNPYGILVGVLSFLIAFLSVGTVIILYRQSREYREMYQKTIKDFERALQKKIDSIGSDAVVKIDSLIETKTNELENLTGDTKKETQKIIDDLKERKESIGSEIKFSSLNHLPYSDSPLNLGLEHNFITSPQNSWKNIGAFYDPTVCPKCNSFIGFLNNSKYCSNCGHKL